MFGWGIAIGLGVLLAIAGTAKLLLPRETRLLPRRSLARAVGAGELAIGLWLATVPSLLAVIGAAALGCLFTVLSWRSFHRGEECGCLGQLRTRPTQVQDVAQAGVFTILAICALALWVTSQPAWAPGSLLVGGSVVGSWFLLQNLGRTRPAPSARTSGSIGVGRRDLIVSAAGALTGLAIARLHGSSVAAALTEDDTTDAGKELEAFLRLQTDHPFVHSELVPKSTALELQALVPTVRSVVPVVGDVAESRTYLFSEEIGRVLVIRHRALPSAAVTDVFGVDLENDYFVIPLMTSTAEMTDFGVKYQVVDEFGNELDSGSYLAAELSSNCDTSCTAGSAAAAGGSAVFCTGVGIAGCSHPLAWATCAPALATCATFAAGAAAAATMSCEECKDAEEDAEEEVDDCGCVMCWD